MLKTGFRSIQVPLRQVSLCYIRISVTCSAYLNCKCSYLFTYLLTYLLTPWSKVLLEKLTVLIYSRNSPHFTEPESSQVPATCPSPEPDRSSPRPQIPLPEDPS